jgi:type IV secretory pathway VirB2 component (pilin)
MGPTGWAGVLGFTNAISIVLVVLILVLAAVNVRTLLAVQAE